MNRREWELHKLKDCTETLITHLNDLREETSEIGTTLQWRSIICILDNLISLDEDIRELIDREQ